MRGMISFSAAILALTTSTCSAPGERQMSAAESVFVNGSIWTGVEGAPRAEAIAVARGRIVFVGTGNQARDFVGPHTEVVDLNHAFVAPGFIDNHTHFVSGGLGIASVQLRDAATPEEFSRRIGDFAKTIPEGRWIRYGDWDHEAWGGDLPQRQWIDALTPANPVFVSRLDGHMGLANSAALALAGIDASTPDPPGGEIVRGANGAPTGILKDAAMTLVMGVMPPHTEEEVSKALAAAQVVALAHGVTQIHDVSDGDWRNFDAFRREQKSGRLELRVYSLVPLPDWERLAEIVEKEGRGDDRLRWGGVKGFVDGSLGSTTAWFFQPFSDAPDSSGMPITDLGALESWIKGADSAGLQIAVHAIGDRANDWLLDTYARTAGDDVASRRFRIEHAQHLTANAVERFAQLGVIASMQPYHAIDDGRWAEKRIGPERIKLTYAFRSLIDAGATVTFGSDWSVAPLDPLAGIYAAVTRRTIDGANPGGWVPEQKITVEEALVGYTRANAYAGFQERDVGTLETGKLADFVVLSQDLFLIDPTTIAGVEVNKTVIDGKTVYEKPSNL